MKKLFTLLLLAAGLSLTASAQVKKTWDFTQGWSDETKANLDADATNWSKDATNADGTTSRWKDLTKMTGTLYANGEPIKELMGLSFSGFSNANSNYLIQKTSFRLTRDNTVITLPKLANGQTVTIVGRSANSTATDRGIAPVQSHLKYVGDEAQLTNGNCRFLGNQATGSLGTYTFKWQVQTEEADSVDVQFKLTPKGGIDFTLFMIDDGDAPVLNQVAYLYSTASGYAAASDQVLAALQANEKVNVTPIEVTATTDLSVEALTQYDVVVVSSAFDATADAAATLKQTMPFVPTLGMNSGLYTGEWGATDSRSSAAVIKDKGNSLFKGIDFSTFVSEETGVITYPLGFSATGVALGTYFSGDARPAVHRSKDEVTVIHTHNITHNGYIYLPVPFDTELSDDLRLMLGNAINMLGIGGSKQDVSEAATPVITQDFKNLRTNVTITPSRTQPKTRFYYTLNGDEPTEQSTPYEGTFSVDQVCTVKAVAIAEGYTLSKAAQLDIEIYEQPKTPTIEFTQGEKESSFKLACATENATVWYNFSAAIDTVKSSKYLGGDSVAVVIDMPQTVTAFSTVFNADSTRIIFSEPLTQRVLVTKPRIVADVAGHFRAAKWDDVAAGNGIFTWGKNADTQYDPESEGEVVEIDGQETIVKPLRQPEVREEPGDNPQWKVVSYGQSVLWQNISASTAVIGSNDGGYYPSVAEDIDALFPISSYDVQFYKIFDGEAPNASIGSIYKFQAPLDVVVLANLQGGPLVVQVSADSLTWTTVGDEIAKTGFSRMWKKYTRSYDGTDEVYVRVAQLRGDMSAKVFDVYVANQGEKSQALLAEIEEEVQQQTGISSASAATRHAAGIYSLSGTRQRSLQRGLNIVVNDKGQARKVLIK